MANNAKQKAFLAEIGEIAAAFRARIESSVDGFDPDPSASQARRKRADDDFEFFCRTYFPHYVNLPNSALHDYLYQRLPAIADSAESETEAIAAPRGEAKSTITSQLFVLWCVLTGRKHYPIIGMDAFDQAAVMLEAIKAELEVNPRLEMDYPDEHGAGRVWKAGVIITRDNAKIEAVGSGKRIRGRRHGPHRPDLFVGDDLENDENVATPAQRDKLQQWIAKAVLKLGGAGRKFDTIIIGTILHYDSVLARLLKNPLWSGRKFRAIVVWPERMDLWDQWEEVYSNEGKDAADEFHRARHAAMEAGAVVSWPGGRPLLELMRLRARDGHSSFDSELQNDPLSGEDAVFGDSLTYWVQPCRNWEFYGAVDPSLGKSGRGGDPSAILVGGYDREHGILDVVEARIRKRLPSVQIAEVIALQQEYLCRLWGVESVQFQEFFRTELIAQSAAEGVPVPARPVTPHGDKELRIEALQPHCSNGLIRFSQRHTTLLEQLRHFPKADHDDGPDALEILWSLVPRRIPGASDARGYHSLGRRRSRR